MVNPHSVLLCHRDLEMRKSADAATLVLPDGVGIVLAANVLGYAHQGRVTGPTLLLRLCDEGRAHGYRHFFYGGAAGIADELAERLCLRYPGLQVAGTYCPPFRRLSGREDVAIVRRINSTRPDIVWVGLGAPKQEKWLAAHKGRINATAMIGVGAAFDFHSGNVKWAPRWIRKIGCEWAFRLVREPKRMWRRNVDNTLFLFRLFSDRRRQPKAGV